MAEKYWLTNSTRSMFKRYAKNKQNKDQFFGYMLIDYGRIIGVIGNKPPLIKKRERLKMTQLEMNERS